MIQPVTLPEVGEGITTVDISEVSVQMGDTIATDDVILILETDKATMEIPSTISGTVQEVLVKAGDTIEPGSVLIQVEVDEDESPAENGKDADSIPQIVEEDEPTPISSSSHPPVKLEAENRVGEISAVDRKILASPAVRKYARELGCDLNLVRGSGEKGRITKEDILAFVKNSLTDGPIAAPAPAKSPLPEVSSGGAEEEIPLNRIRLLTGERMQNNWQTIPHVTQFDESDITDLENLRRALKNAAEDDGVRITFLPFLMKAAVLVLQEFPDFNSSLSQDGRKLIRKNYYNIGVAVDTPTGLMVPVVREVDSKGIRELAVELADISSRARDRKVLPEELKGGTFTISSLGGIGGTAFTPIINAPEVAILGISRSQTKPVYHNKEWLPRNILPFSLSYDHRVIDGAAAVRFSRRLGEWLSDPNRLLARIL